MRNIIRELCALPGISGRENAVRRYITEHLQDAPAVTSIYTDRMGNCIVSLKGKQAAPHKVMFAAHMDEVGGIVTGITDDGYVRFDTVGGITPDVLFARTVWVNEHAGIIGSKAIHQCEGDEKKTVPAVSKMLIDIGADSEKEARQYVAEGDAVTFSPNFMTMVDQRFCTKALDDRIGCALLLCLAHTEPLYDTTLVFTVQEEVGLRGAATAAFAVKPEIAVIIDATTAADVADVPPPKTVTCQNKGPVVSFMDKQTLYDHALYTHIRAIAEQNGIPTQTKTMIAGGNDAGAIQRTGEGTRVAAISLPCRYIHSPSCVLSDTDIHNTYRLLELLINDLPTFEDNV